MCASKMAGEEGGLHFSKLFKHVISKYYMGYRPEFFISCESKCLRFD